MFSLFVLELAFLLAQGSEAAAQKPLWTFIARGRRGSNHTGMALDRCIGISFLSRGAALHLPKRGKPHEPLSLICWHTYLGRPTSSCRGDSHASGTEWGWLRLSLKQ